MKHEAEAGSLIPMDVPLIGVEGPDRLEGLLTDTGIQEHSADLSPDEVGDLTRDLLELTFGSSEEDHAMKRGQ